VGCGDIEQHDFVRAFAGMTGGESGGVTGVDDVDKLHTFDNAASVDIEAGDDALGDHGFLFTT
jgi:hypothetical protein